MTNIIINKRFCGPKNSANGGYAAGVFAQTIDGPAVVTLKSPPPLDTPIDLRKTEHRRHGRHRRGDREALSH